MKQSRKYEIVFTQAYAEKKKGDKMTCGHQLAHDLVRQMGVAEFTDKAKAKSEDKLESKPPTVKAKAEAQVKHNKLNKDKVTKRK